MGHKVKLMPPQCVKPYVKRQKYGMTEAAAAVASLVQDTGDSAKTGRSPFKFYLSSEDGDTACPVRPQ